MNIGFMNARRATYVAVGLAIAMAPVVSAVGGETGSAPRVLADCQEVGGGAQFPGSEEGSFSMSCQPSVIPNTSTEDNLTEQEVAQPGFN